jgi:hypothetical protein
MDARKFVPHFCCNSSCIALEYSAIGQLFQRLHFRNHVFEWLLVGRPVQSPLPAKFGLANRCWMGILSVSRSVQGVSTVPAPEHEAKLEVPEQQTAPFRQMTGRPILVKNRLFHRKG